MNRHQHHTDDQLLHFISENDERAFTELYNRYWKLIFSVAINKLDDEEEAQEVVQEVFADVWKRREEIEIKHSVRSFLAGAARFQIYTIMRRNYKMKIVGMDSASSLSNEVSLTEAYNAKLLKEQIESAVQTLPEACRLVFKLSRNEGKKNREIAELLNISEKTVENHMTKALKRLRLSIKSFFLLFF